MAFYTPHRVVAATTAAGLVLTSDAAGHSSYIFSSFQIGSSGNGIGQGGFALENIASGDRILAEAPLVSFVVPDRKKIRGAEMAALLKKSIGELDEVRTAAFFALTQLPDGNIAGLMHSFEAAFGIWMTNAYPTTNGASEGGDGQAVFEQICRLNHACHPNAVLSWNAELGVQTMHAVTDIRKGDELTVAYWDDEGACMTRSERQQLAHERFSFICECATCQLTGVALDRSDDHHRKAKVLIGLIDRCAARVGSSSNSDAGQDLGAHERLCESVRALVILLREASMPHTWARAALLRAAWSAGRCGDWAAARAWAVDAAKCAYAGSGRESPAYCAIEKEHLCDFRAVGAGTWRRVENAAFGGYDVIASRVIRRGEVIMSEQPLLATDSPDSSSEEGWASASLRDFCAAPAAVQRAVLQITAVGDHADESGGECWQTSRRRSSCALSNRGGRSTYTSTTTRSGASASSSTSMAMRSARGGPPSSNLVACSTIRAIPTCSTRRVRSADAAASWQAATSATASRCARITWASTATL
jgi:hypothetical protein